MTQGDPDQVAVHRTLTFTCTLCGAFHDAGTNHYTCPQCGPDAILELRDLPPVDPDHPFTDAPGMWRYERLLPLDLSSARPPLPVGGTPLVPAERLGARLGLRHLSIKNDALNPTGSLKDRASAAVLVRAVEIGARHVAVASTGNAGSSLAGLAASMGMGATIFVPRSAPGVKILQSRLYGARVVAVDGTYDDAFDLCVEACEAFGWYNRSTALNPYTIEGKKTVSFEIYEQLGDRSPDMVIVPTGDGCILSGVAQGFRNLRQLGRIDRMPRLVAVQAEGSDAIVRMVEGVHPDADFRARSIADSITVSVPRNGRMAARDVLESGGRAIRVSDDAILAAVSELASWTGIFAEPAAAAALAGLRVLLALEEVPPDASVVLLITGSGLKDPRAAASVAAEPILVGRSLLELRKALDHCGATEGAW